MEDKITIIEGPPPTFEAVAEDWVWGLNESPTVAGVVATRLRTFNGPSLLERCQRAWKNKMSIFLEYRNMEGLTQEVPIVAARNMNTNDGDMLVLWVRIPNNDIEIEIGYEDELDADLKDELDAFIEDEFGDEEDFDDDDDYDLDDDLDLSL